METKVVTQVLKTYEYEAFKKLLGNRTVENSDRIGKSTAKVGQLCIPIIVNERMEIIEGQHRFDYWKNNNMPILFIVCEGYGIKECIAMNTTSKNWGISDYINCYAKYGNEDYIALQQMESMYASEFSAALVRAVCIGNMDYQGQDRIKAGTFRMGKSIAEIEATFEFLRQFKLPKNVRGYKNRLYTVLRFCYETPCVDNTVLLKQWNSYAAVLVESIATISQAAEAIESVYNYKRKKASVYIATEYKRAAEERCAAVPGGGVTSWREDRYEHH